MASRDFLKHVVSTSEPVGSTLGDEYYNPSSNKLFKRLAVNGTSVQWVESQQGIAVQSSGITRATGARTINFPGSTISYDSITDTVTIQSSGIPGGSDTQVQFNNAGSFGGSSNLTWNGTVLNVTGRIETNGSRVVDYKNATAQWTMNGGGLVTWNGTAILWNQRVIVIPVENTEMGSAGYFDITCPTSGTVVYYNSVNVTTTLTCTAAGIPLGAWEALYYEVAEGMASTTDQTRFRVVNYQNTVWRPSTGWILLASVNGDGTNIGHLKWLPGQVNLPTTGSTVTYNTGTGISSWAVGAGTVTSVSVASANGFAGTVATSTSTPAITISTSITGLLKGNGTAISAATAGTDYQTAQSVTGIVKSSGTTRSAAVAGTDYLAPPTGTALLKANSGGALANAVAGTDYQTAQSVTGIVKSSGTTRSAAVAGTDYQAPIGTISGIAKGNGANALTAAVAGTDFVAPSGTFFIGTTSIAHNRASATLSMTGVNIDGSAGSAGVASTVTTTASTTNSAFKIPMLNTTGVATGNFGLLLDSAGASDFTFNPSTNTLTVGVAEVTSPTPATINAIRARSNIAWQSPSATSTITSKMLDAGTLSFEGTVGQLFSITNSMTGTIFSVNDISGIPSIEVLDTGVVKIAQYAGFVAYGVSAALTATGISQGTALALTRPINDVTTVAASTGVVFPAATPGMRIVIRNGGSNTLNVYPASGAQINALGTNVAFPLTITTVLEFIALSTTQWYTLNVTYA